MQNNCVNCVEQRHRTATCNVIEFMSVPISFLSGKQIQLIHYFILAQCSMFSVRFVSLIGKVLVVALGVVLGWLFANSYEVVSRENFTENVKSVPKNGDSLSVIPDNVEVAAKLAEIVRLLCLIPTSAGQHKENAYSLQNTWGRHCNKLVFVTDKFDQYVNASNAIVYHSTGKNETSWHKLKYALQQVHDKYNNEFDWILKAEQTNYVIVENIRYMLHSISSSQPNVVARYAGPTKIDDESAYVLSKEAVRRLATAFSTQTNCSGDRNVQNEFTKMSECLAEVQANFVKSQDADGRELFLKDNVMGTINSLKSPNDFRTEISNYTAVWPRATPHDLYVFNFLIYDVRSYGAPQDMPPLQNVA